MNKRVLIIIVWLIVMGLTSHYVVNLYQLIAKTYYIDESKLYKIDTFHLFNRAFEQSDNSGVGRNPSSKPELVFTSTNCYSFVIDGNLFQAIVDRKKLEDTLMYHDLKFTIYSDKEKFEEYKKSKTPFVSRFIKYRLAVQSILI